MNEFSAGFGTMANGFSAVSMEDLARIDGGKTPCNCELEVSTRPIRGALGQVGDLIVNTVKTLGSAVTKPVDPWA